LNVRSKPDLLKVEEGKSIKVDAFLEKGGVPLSVAGEVPRHAHDERLVKIIAGNIEVSDTRRLKLAVKALENGVDIEQVCKTAGWRDFEDLVALIVESNEYRTWKHFRFRMEDRIREVDVLAIKGPLMLAIECKRWRKSWKTMETRRVAENHLEKTMFLLKALPNLATRLDPVNWRVATLLPVVLTLSETPIMVEKGVPVVPIYRFKNFLSDFEGHLEELAVLNYAKSTD